MTARRRLYLSSRRIIDGTGSPSFTGTVEVEGDRLVAVHRGRLGPVPADAEVIDLGDLVLAPGIVDLHTHSDVSMLSDPGCISAVVQGVTTQIVGHCGFSAAPVDEMTKTRIVEEEPVFGFPNVGWNWASTSEYLKAVGDASVATNTMTLVGHNTVRRLVMGSVARPATAAERSAMVAHLQAALADGAAGVTTGLSYAPGVFADADELEAIARAAANAGRRYHTHMRYGKLSARESLAEAIATARAADVALNVSHLYPGVTDPIDEAAQMLDMVDDARNDGLEVTFDLTVFPRGGGAFAQLLPSWAHEGGMAATVGMIKDPATRSLLVAELVATRTPESWDDALIVKVNDAANAALVNRTIGAIARERDLPPAECALDLIVEDGQFWIAPVIKRQDDLDLLLSHPVCVPVTDGMAAHPVLHRDLGVMPKTFGSFPLVLGSYVRDRGVLGLEQAVAKMTSLAAQRAGITDRGRIAAGLAADLVVFDAEKVGNRATEDDPVAFPAGIVHTIVGGQFALRDGQLTGTRNGQALRAM